MSERPMLPVRTIRPRPMLPVLSRTDQPDANNTPRDVSVSLTNAEFEALQYVFDFVDRIELLHNVRWHRQALADARMALDALSDGMGLS